MIHRGSLSCGLGLMLAGSDSFLPATTGGPNLAPESIHNEKVHAGFRETERPTAPGSEPGDGMMELCFHAVV